MEDKNTRIEYICSRMQKITEALYRVTDFFPDTEPLKWSLRNECLGILNESLKMRVRFYGEKRALILGIIEKIEGIFNIIDLASSGTFISQSNFEVIKKEYFAVHEFLKSNMDELVPNAKISFPEFNPVLDIPKQDNISDINSDSIVKDMLQNGHKKESGDDPYSAGRDANNRRSPVRLSQKLAVSLSPAKDSDRLSRITEYIKEKGWVSVGEVTKIFEGKFSEKTLQRDLARLVGRGEVIKTGDKRWRRYGILTS